MSDGNAQDALIQLMLAAAAADGSISDKELREVDELMSFLPVFDGFDRARLAGIADQNATLLSSDDGIDAIIANVTAKVPVRLYETAYALAVEVISADVRATQAELRLLEMLRDAFDMDRLTAGAIEHSARVRYRRLD
ncbi:tellurite resistance TerB family protein [Fulvimarina sp. 2208YS6-2-32]|uniref:Tellurite resistance TerB family protein n=1 Tax=Fulvimarina uroteuthidis TaxID=3098149 RepID=A0ABU5I2H8_9HYPH|nr:tellurite resistance TerB family protein [Fulvimarina sp. 2208YS6-2-32]MDY8109577.1 tellurite resistance TerB family protein [Fulvimarina sp. 2208YS6-2-32]